MRCTARHFLFQFSFNIFNPVRAHFGIAEETGKQAAGWGLGATVSSGNLVTFASHCVDFDVYLLFMASDTGFPFIYLFIYLFIKI